MTDQEQLIESLVGPLVQETALAFSKLAFASPVVRFRVEYYDTCAPAAYFLCHALTAREREEILSSVGEEALRMIWDSHRGTEIILGRSDATKPLLAKLYEQLCAEPNATLTRKMATRLCETLNTILWPENLQVADEFIAYSANGTDHGCDVYEDICNAVPDEKRELLSQLGLMGRKERDWDVRTDVTPTHVVVEQMVERIGAFDKQEQIEQWLRVLEGTLSGSDAGLKRTGVNPKTPLGYLVDFGSDAATPLLKFAARWTKRIEIWADGWEPTPDVPSHMCSIIEFVGEQGMADAETERLLVHVLSKSVDYPFLGLSEACCEALHQLFEKYPEPEATGNWEDLRPHNLNDFLPPHR